MYISDIDKKIRPDYGTGLSFNMGQEKFVTEHERSGEFLEIGVNVTSFIETCRTAIHLYASFNIPSVRCINSKGEKFFSSNQPKESHSLRIDIDYVSCEEMYSDTLMGRFKICGIGEKTIKFDSIKKLIEIVEFEFNRIFGEPWKLVEFGTNESWESYKKELIEEYDFLI